MTLRLRPLQRPRRQRGHVPLLAIREDRHADLLPQRLELVDRRRTVDVQRRQHRAPPLPRQPLRQLRRRRRLPGTLEPDQQDDRRPDRRRLEPLALLAQERDQLVVHDLDDLLPRRHRLEHLLAQRALLDLRQEIARELVVHVGLEQDAPNLPQPILDHGLGEQASLLETAEYAVQLFRKLLEHPSRGAGYAIQSL